MHTRSLLRRFFLPPAALALALGTAVAADWPQFLGPTRNGVSTEKGLIDTFPAKGPPLLWERAVGEGYSGPVVADGVVFLFHRVKDEEVLEALDAATGKAVWKHAYPCTYEDAYSKGNGPRATPVVASGKVYTLGAGGVLSCVDSKNGKKVWQRALADDYKLRPTFFGVGSTPLVEGDLVLLNGGAEDAGIVALDRNTGKEVWRATDHDASYASPVAATIDGVRHALFFTREGLVSLDPATGKVRFSKRWRSRINASVNAATPVVLPGGLVFVTASYGTGAALWKVQKDQATEVWKSDKVLSAHFTTPVAVGPYLFGVDGRQEEGAQLRCIEWATGKVRWTEPGFGCGAVLAVGDRLVLLSESGELILADARGDKFEGKARAQVLRGPVRAHPALADGKFYARDDGKLACWDLKKK